jgi:diaminopimelate epimerase
MTRSTPPTGLPFRKMHGAGNDFVIIDARDGGDPITPALAQALGDRNRGVGFDQLAVMRPSQEGDITLDFWNADGSRAGACGNATRCVAHLLMAETGQMDAVIRTKRGLLHAKRMEGAIWVNMGQPQLDWAEVPLRAQMETLHLDLPGAPSAVGMGNPHCIHFVADAEAVDLPGQGAMIEHHPLFPQRTNVEFASLLGTDRLRLRVWERGAGVTLACGSGACATVVAAHRRGLTGPRIELVMDGGTLIADWRADGVWLSGPVAHVFDGVLAPGFGAHP